MLVLHRNMYAVEGLLPKETLGLCTCGEAGVAIEYDPGKVSICRCQSCYDIRKLQLSMQGNRIVETPYTKHSYGKFDLAGAIVKTIVPEGNLLKILTHDDKSEVVVYSNNRLPMKLSGSSIVMVERVANGKYRLTFLTPERSIIKLML